MSRLLTMVFILLSMAATNVAAQQPIWVGDYGLGLAVCRASEKPLLIVIEEPEQPSFKIRPVSAITKETNHRLLANYTLCRVEASTPYGRSVAKAFKVDRYPFTAIIDKRGSHILYKKIGVFSETDWVNTLVEYKSGERKQLAAEFCFP